MAEQQWRIEAFFDTTLLSITITTDDQDLERGQDIGVATKAAIERCVSDLSLKDAANRVLGLTFRLAGERAQP